MDTTIQAVFYILNSTNTYPGWTLLLDVGMQLELVAAMDGPNFTVAITPGN